MCEGIRKRPSAPFGCGARSQKYDPMPLPGFLPAILAILEGLVIPAPPPRCSLAIAVENDEASRVLQGVEHPPCTMESQLFVEVPDQAAAADQD